MHVAHRVTPQFGNGALPHRFRHVSLLAIHRHTYTLIFTHTHTHTHLNTRLHTNTHKHTHKKYTHIHTHTYTHSTHAHTHTEPHLGVGRCWCPKKYRQVLKNVVRYWYRRKWRLKRGLIWPLDISRGNEGRPLLVLDLAAKKRGSFWICTFGDDERYFVQEDLLSHEYSPPRPCVSRTKYR